MYFLKINFFVGNAFEFRMARVVRAGLSAQADVRGRPADCCSVWASSAVPRSIVCYRRCYDAFIYFLYRTIFNTKTHHLLQSTLALTNKYYLNLICFSSEKIVRKFSVIPFYTIHDVFVNYTKWILCVNISTLRLWFLGHVNNKKKRVTRESRISLFRFIDNDYRL